GRTVLVANLAAFQQRYGTGISVAGQYVGKLSNAGAEISLATNFGQSIEDFTYSDNWYGRTDGDGYSLVAIDPNAGNDVLSTSAGWRPSALVYGAPGSADPG